MSSNICSKEPQKIALDDFCVMHGKNARTAFKELPEEAYAESKELWALSVEIAAVNDPNAVWEFAARRFLKSHQDFKNRFADRNYKVAKANGEGFKEVNTFEQWQKWEHKRRYKGVCYAPGKDEIVDDCINTWPGWGCEPKKGSVKEFTDLLNFIFDGEDALRDWFLQWLAYPLQNPGAKNLTAVLLISEAQGVGKSFIGYIMGEIYGDNFSVIDAESLASSNNGYCVNKQLILGEEITGGNSRANADRLKNMITRESIYVNIKYQPQYHIADLCNWLLTSNHVDALFLETRDRRVVVHDIKSAPQPFDFYKRIDKWRINGGPAHVFEYLLNDIDLSDYDPKHPAPMTRAKSEMIALSKSDLDLAVEQMRDNPDSILCGRNIINDCPLLTTTQLQHFINSYTDGRSTLIAISKALRRAKFRQEQINVVDGCHKVWAVRDLQKLGRLDASEWVAIYNDFHPQKKF